MRISVLILTILLSGGCKIKASQNSSTDTTTMKSSLTIHSSAFQQDSAIPQRFTCQGDNISPAFQWSGAPSGTQSFALVCEDPDAPHGTFYHWVMYNIPATEHGLAENIEKRDRLANGTRQGVNSFQQMGYGGPCPPPGNPHRYYFKLFALDTQINIPGEATRDELMSAIQGHVLAEGETMGTYQKK